MQNRLREYDGPDAKPITPDGATALIVDDQYINAAVKLIGTAQSEVRLCAYAWRWYENEPEISIQILNAELWRLRRRGVKIRCLVDTEKMKNTFATLGFDVRAVVATRMLHTKAIGVDSRGLLIGSHNLTKRANSDNYEMSILTHEFQVVDAYNDYFDNMWNSRG